MAAPPAANSRIDHNTARASLTVENTPEDAAILGPRSVARYWCPYPDEGRGPPGEGTDGATARPLGLVDLVAELSQARERPVGTQQVADAERREGRGIRGQRALR